MGVGLCALMFLIRCPGFHFGFNKRFGYRNLSLFRQARLVKMVHFIFSSRNVV